MSDITDKTTQAMLASQGNKVLPSANTQTNIAQRSNQSVNKDKNNSKPIEKPVTGQIKVPTSDGTKETQKKIQEATEYNRKYLEDQAKKAGVMNYSAAQALPAGVPPKFLYGTGAPVGAPVGAPSSGGGGNNMNNTVKQPAPDPKLNKDEQKVAKAVADPNKSIDDFVKLLGKGLKNIDLAKIVSDAAGAMVSHGARGQLAYAGDFNYRTPQELELAKKIEVMGEIQKQQGEQAAKLDFEKSMSQYVNPVNFQQEAEKRNIPLQKEVNKGTLATAETGIIPGVMQANQAERVAVAGNPSNTLFVMDYLDKMGIKNPTPEQYKAAEAELIKNSTQKAPIGGLLSNVGESGMKGLAPPPENKLGNATRLGMKNKFRQIITTGQTDLPGGSKNG
jgi:hypothetical protein